MNRYHPPRYPAPAPEDRADWLDVAGRILSLAVFAAAIVIVLAVVQ